MASRRKGRLYYWGKTPRASIVKKPPQILEIEKLSGVHLRWLNDNESFKDSFPSRTPFRKLNDNSYKLNDSNEIVELSISSYSIPLLEAVSELRELEKLSLRNCYLSNIEIIKSLEKLKFLDLSENKIEDIKPIYELKQIEELNLSSNRIVSIEKINCLENLEYLNLSSNGIKKIPNINRLQKLKNLDLSNNLIESCDIEICVNKIELIDLSKNEIGNIKNLSKIENIVNIKLNENQIQSIENIENIPLLFSLNIDNNAITEIPQNIFFKQLPKYDGLDFLSIVKRFKYNAVKIQDYLLARDLKTIEEEYHMFYDTDKWDEWSHQKNNFIRSLYKKQLLIHFRNNPLTSPPIDDVVNLDIEKVVEWYEQITLHGTEPLYEAKLLIVGEPNTGKTSLRKKLLNIDYVIPNNEEKETLGVYVHNGYMFPYYKDPTINISTHIWDFGGQEKQYPLHQYFLRDKSVYVLLSSDREDNVKIDKWFHTIKLLSGNDTNIIVVLNQKNKSTQSINFDEEKYKRLGFKFKIFPLDFGKDKERLLELQNEINKEISNLEHIGGPYPKYCKSIAEIIDKKRFDEGKDYLLYEEYEEICENLNSKDPKLLEKSLQYLSITGKVIHYSDDENLERIIIINPHWLIDAIYGVLTCEDLDEYHKKGRFTKQWLIDFLSSPTEIRPNGYNKSESLHILNLMLKNHFDICYNVGKNYLTPLCMPATLPTNNYIESIDNLQILFRYEVMPSGIVARLLVRLSEFIDDDLISRTKGILKKGENQAKIEEYEFENDGNKYIRVSISGNKSTSKEFLDIIKQELIKIHKSWFKDLELDELIPCDCSECSKSQNFDLFKISDLKTRLGKNKFTIECRKSSEDINILKLTGKLYDLGIDNHQQINSKEDLFNLLSKSGASFEKFDILARLLNNNEIFQQFFINMGGDTFNIQGNNPNSQFGSGVNIQNNINDYSQNISNIVQNIEERKNEFTEKESITSLEDISTTLANIDGEIDDEKNKTILKKLTEKVQNFWKTIKNESEKKLADKIIITPIIYLLTEISKKTDVHNLIELLSHLL